MATHHLDDTQPHACWDNTLPILTSAGGQSSAKSPRKGLPTR
jgi:hypothetical protein